MLDLALSYAARGWYVFPCWPKTKKPMTAHGFKDATTDPEQIRAWWAQKPDANIAIACGPSNLAVLDVDHGLTDEAALAEFIGSDTPTFIVRTGRRPEFGAQLYYEGAVPDVGLWKRNGCEGQVKSAGGYVMAPGSIHPDSGLPYEVYADNPLSRTPDWVRELKKAEREAYNFAEGKRIPEGGGRRNALTSVAGSLRARGLGGDAIYAALLPLNEEMCEVPVTEEQVREIAYGVARRYAPDDPGPEVVIGRANPAGDWREHYHTFDELDGAPPLSFLIEDFLHAESITGIAAAVAQRKSLVALNIAHSLCTGEPLFGKFRVIERPKRVLYICPEMGMRSFSKRLRGIGLMPYVCKTLFCRTMNREDRLGLEDLQTEELDGAVVIIDTAIRFMTGDENSSEDMRRLADSLFRLIPRDNRPGAAAVIVLYHSGKANKETSELTLENTLRGSGELGAALTCCWATRLQDPDKQFESLSFLTCVKPRDFDEKPKDFEVTCAPSSKMTYVEQATEPVLKQRSRGNVADKDGKDTAALEVIKQHPDLSGVKLSALLKEHDIQRSPDWINRRKAEMRGTGNRLNSA